MADISSPVLNVNWLRTVGNRVPDDIQPIQAAIKPMGIDLSVD
jgi:hypothetical protein